MVVQSRPTIKRADLREGVRSLIPPAISGSSLSFKYAFTVYAFTVYMYHIHRQPVVVCNESLTAATLLGLALRKECDLISVGSLAQPLVDLAIVAAGGARVECRMSARSAQSARSARSQLRGVRVGVRAVVAGPGVVS